MKDFIKWFNDCRNGLNGEALEYFCVAWGAFVIVVPFFLVALVFAVLIIRTNGLVLLVMPVILYAVYKWDTRG